MQLLECMNVTALPSPYCVLLCVSVLRKIKSQQEMEKGAESFEAAVWFPLSAHVPSTAAHPAHC